MPRDRDVETAIELVDPLVGTVFDKRFRIEQRLAAGGFGAIYRATHVKSGHAIALKVLHPTLAADLGVLARFRREGATLTSLRNPHTITAYEVGQVEHTLFIVMELLHGVSLFEHYRAKGPFEWKRMVKIACEVCESLEEAHALGIVHRDLKPTNIHLEEQGDDPDFVKVLDFGIAKILGGSDLDASDITNAGQMIGTLDYMSPEQMVGGAITGQTDIYTLGIVMYEMIAGVRPFPDTPTAAAALAAMIKTKPEALYLRAPVPQELDRVVMRCLERETKLRYRTVTELRGELERTLTGATAVTATVELDIKAKSRRDDDDETTITPPPERILAALRASESRPSKTAASKPASQAERRSSQTPPHWTDDDEAPTTTGRPDGGPPRTKQPSLPQPNAPRASTVLGPASPPLPIAPTAPTPRPLATRHLATPVPQVVVAPFSSTPREVRTPVPHQLHQPPVPTPHIPTPLPHQHIPTPLPHHVATPVPNQPTPHPNQPNPWLQAQPPQARAPSPNPTQTPYPLAPAPQQPVPQTGSRNQPQYDMGRLAAREAAIRRLIWILVLVIGGGVGVIVAMRL